MFSEDLKERFLQRVQKGAPNECWPYGGIVGKRYGFLKANGKTWGAHRVAWVIANNRDVPEGLYILHSCDNPPCCNPAHLRPGTASENMFDRARNPPRRQRRAIERSRRVDAAATRLFEQVGLWGATIRDIAKMAKVSPSAVIEDDGSKEALFARLMGFPAPNLREFLERVREGADAAELASEAQKIETALFGRNCSTQEGD